MRAKYIMDARNAAALSAIHTCCLPAGVRAHPPPESACALVDHVPLEEWHLRHLRQLDEACRARPIALSRQDALERRSSMVTSALDAPLPDVPLPPSWRAEVSAAARELLARVRHVEP